jgi:hypothetical protein
VIGVLSRGRGLWDSRYLVGPVPCKLGSDDVYRLEEHLLAIPDYSQQLVRRSRWLSGTGVSSSNEVMW